MADDVTIGKNAVVSLKNVASEMSRVLSRIDQLETTLRRVRNEVDRLNKSLGNSISIDFYDGKAYSFKKTSDILAEVDRMIASSL